jgi:hypothetical protein
MIDFIVKHWIEIIISLIMYAMGFVTTYTKQRATNLALKSDNKRLVEETEEIKKKYDLEIQKRKYQYESKREQYFKYINMLNSFSATSSNKFLTEFPPIIAKFNEDMVNATEDKEKQAKAIADYTEFVNNFIFKANESLIKIKQETDGIRIIASEKVENILNELEKQYQKSLDLSSIMINAISKMILLKQNDSLEQAKKDVDEIGEVSSKLKKDLINEVKRELDSI